MRCFAQGRKESLRIVQRADSKNHSHRGCETWAHHHALSGGRSSAGSNPVSTSCCAEGLAIIRPTRLANRAGLSAEGSTSALWTYQLDHCIGPFCIEALCSRHPHWATRSASTALARPVGARWCLEMIEHTNRRGYGYPTFLFTNITHPLVDLFGSYVATSRQSRIFHHSSITPRCSRFTPTGGK